MNADFRTTGLETDLRPVAVLMSAASVMTLCALSPAGAPWKLAALPFALLAPGYAVMIALFGSRRPDPVITLALSATLSLALYPLMTLTLWLFGVAPTPLSITAATDVVITVLARIALARALAQQGEPRLIPLARVTRALTGFTATRVKRLSLTENRLARRSRRWNPVPVRGASRLVAFLLLASCAVAVEQRVLPAAQATPYTEFYLAGRWTDVSRIVSTPPNGRLRVQVAVVNRTHSTQTYRVVPLVDATRWHVQIITLPSEQTWTGTVDGRVAHGCLRRLRISLHQQGTSPGSAIGRLTLWVRNGSSPNACSPARPSVNGH